MEYLIQKETLDSIGNAVRSVSEKTDPILVSGLADEIRALSSLNFRVVGGTAQPTDPRENDIWVNTDTRITEWIFSATKTENPTEGMVWFATGVTSGAAFNAVRKNGIVLYPVEAQQYVGGAWMKVTAQSYQNGAWRDWWAGELYTPGNEFEEVTGGWTALALKQTSTGNASEPTITRGEDGLVMTNSNTNYSGGIVHTARKIEISGRSRLVFTGVSNVPQKDRAALTVWSDIGSLQTDNVIASVALPTSEGTAALDISALNGSYYVGFALYRSSATTPTVTMRSLRME